MSRVIIWAVDFGDEKVTALAGESKASKGLALIGGAQGPTQGLTHGEFVHTGDVTECLVAVLRAAERSCGLRCESIFFNFDDAQMESHYPIGSKTLAGEGQIHPVDVEQAVASAGRFVSHFEKSAVYSGRISFVIDGKDSVVNPVGVFGRQLEVGLHVLLARARRLENWRRVMDRARLKQGMPVLSAMSSVYGSLEARELSQKRVVYDLGADIFSAVALERGVLQEYEGRASHAMSASETVQWVVATCQNFSAKHGEFPEVILTGDGAAKESLVHKIKEAMSGNVRVGAPSGFAPFDRPEHAAAAGLLRVGAEFRAQGPMARVPRASVDDFRQKAVSLINEYF